MHSPPYTAAMLALAYPLFKQLHDKVVLGSAVVASARSLSCYRNYASALHRGHLGVQTSPVSKCCRIFPVAHSVIFGE